MRIPLSKVYRAFPELDRFSDEECERFEHWVRLQTRQRAQITYGYGIALLVVVTLGIGALASNFRSELGSAAAAIDRILRFNWPRTPDGVGEMILLGCCLILLGLTAGPIGFLWRDRLLRKAIADRLNLVNCPVCRFSLLGLPCVANEQSPSVLCPECGTTTRLFAVGLTPADLVANSRSAENQGSI